MDFSIVLGQIGEFGRFQHILCLYIVFVALLMSFPHITQILISITPDYRCRIDPNDDPSNWIPRDQNGEPSKCKMFANISYEDSSQFKPNIISCKDGLIFDKSIQYNSIITEYKWVCEDSWNEALLQMSFWAGTAIGPLFFGPLVDVFGRRPIIMIVYSIAALTGMLTNFVSDKISIFAVRFLAGVPLNVLCSTPYILGLEYVNSAKRSFLTLVFTTTCSISWIVVPLLAYAVQDWRIFMWTVSPMLLMVVFITWFLPESLTWMIIKKKTDRAVKTIKWIANINNKIVSNDFLEKFTESTDTAVYTKHSFKDLLHTKGIRKIAFLTSISWIIAMYGYTGSIYATIALSSNPFLSIILGSIFEILAPFIQFMLINSIGRRWACISVAILCAISSSISCLFIDGNYWAFMSLMIVARVASTACFNINTQFSAELVPTGIRARCVALRQVVGTAGTILSSYTTYLRIYSKMIPLLVMCGLMLIEALVCLHLPETMNCKLCTNLEEVDRMVEEHKIWDFPCKRYKESKAGKSEKNQPV